MLNKLCDLVDPIYCVKHDKQFVASVKQELLPRLCSQLVSHDDNIVNVALDFYYDKLLKLPAYRLSLVTKLNLECQRSLQPFDFDCKTQVNGVFVEGSARILALTEDLPESIEIYELNAEEDKISLFALIEDELLLMIPLAPIDESYALGGEIDFHNWQDDFSIPSVESNNKPNPFAQLHGLKIQN